MTPIVSLSYLMCNNSVIYNHSIKKKMMRGLNHVYGGMKYFCDVSFAVEYRHLFFYHLFYCGHFQLKKKIELSLMDIMHKY